VLVADGDPFEGGAVAEAVVECGGDAAQEEEVDVAEFGFVFGELSLVAPLQFVLYRLLVHSRFRKICRRGEGCGHLIDGCCQLATVHKVTV
jgi:hypothetical protein